MFIKDIKNSKERVLKLFSAIPDFVEGSSDDLLPHADRIKSKKKEIFDLAAAHKTPFYVFDEEAIREKSREFSKAFKSHVPDCHFYYAMKSNPHEFILKCVVKNGFGLDVSSGAELKTALKIGAANILFSGPGKTLEELELAVNNSRKVTVNIDSFRELEKLGELARKNKKTIRAGVRIFTRIHGNWSKFGIPLEELSEFWRKANKYEYIKLRGIQFHLSWNKTPAAYQAVINLLGEYLGKNFNKKELDAIKFIDFGGGFFPSMSEGYYPWTAHYPGMSPLGKVAKLTDDYFKEETQFETPYYITKSASLNEFASAIGESISTHLNPILKCSYYTEPGRIICNNSMHVVLKVVEVKRPGMVIVDGGVNMTGWEYGEHFYYPIVNLSNFSKNEIKNTIYGPLCTPHDIWGYYCYTKKIREGDVIVVLNQGAYKYGLAQNFIKPIPSVYRIKQSCVF